MTIFMWFLLWIISEVISWGIWSIVTYHIYKGYLGLMDDELIEYQRKQGRIIEWIRFIIWPYGIIQRTIVLHKIHKRVTCETT